MKKNLALSGILSMLGALSIAMPHCQAYKLDVVSSENILHQDTVLDKLEKYESAVLIKLATVLKDTQIDPDSMVTLSLSLDGSIHGLTYKDPGSKIQADSAARKALQNARTINFGEIPSLQSGYIKLSLPYKELVDGNYKRKLYVVQTPEGQSIGGVGGINIGNVLSDVPASHIQISSSRKSNVRRKPADPVPYSEKDRKFDQDITSIYSSFRGRSESSSAFDRREGKSIKDIEEQSNRFLQQENYFAAAQSFLNEAKYFLRLSELDKGKERFEKAKNLLSKLKSAEQEDFIKNTIQTSSTIARGNENFSCREYLLQEGYNLAKDQKISNFDLKRDATQAIADFYMSSGQKNEALSYYKQLLVITTKSKTDPNKAAQTFCKIAALQMTLNDRVQAEKTLLEANRFLEKELGKDSVTLIPILIQMMQNTTDAKVQLVKLDRIENIVDKYKPIYASQNNSTIDQSALSASRALLNEARTNDYRRYNDPASASEINLTCTCARLGYKLKLKADPRFDFSAFNQLAQAMQNAGQFEQAANFYKETIAMLEASNSRESHYSTFLQSGYLRALERAGKTNDAEKIKSDFKAKEEKRIQEIINKMEDALANQKPEDRVKTEIGLFGLYASQKNTSKLNEVLSKLLSDLKTIDGSTSDLNKLGFTLVGPVRTQPELFQADPKMEEKLIRSILLFDEKSQNGIDAMAMNTLTLRIVGGDKNELAKKVSKAITEARQGRNTSIKQDPIVSLDERINSARSNQDYALAAKLRQEKVDAMIAAKNPNSNIVYEMLGLSRSYFEAKQMSEAQKAFDQALLQTDTGKPQDLRRNLSSIRSSVSFYSLHKQYNLMDKGLRKYTDLLSSKTDSTDHDFYRIDHDLRLLTNAYIQNNEFEKAIEISRYVLDKFAKSPTPDKKLITQARLQLSLTLLQIANRDSKRKDSLMQDSEKEFNLALNQITSYYGPKSTQVRNAIHDRMREIKADDLQALESLKKLQDRD